MECLLPYLCMVTVPHIMVGLERMLDYRGVGLERFHCILVCFCFEGNGTEGINCLNSPSIFHACFHQSNSQLCFALTVSTYIVLLYHRCSRNSTRERRTQSYLFATQDN